MEKLNFLILFNIILSLSNAQYSRKDLSLNHLRKLEEKSNETILLGFDNYTTIIPNGYKNYSINFYTYFLFKNWNLTKHDFNDLNPFGISTNINYTNKIQNRVVFNCKYNKSLPIYEDDVDTFVLVRYLCNSNIIEVGIPQIINFTNISEGIEINEYVKYSTSPSVEVFKKDLIKLKNKTMFNMEDYSPDMLEFNSPRFMRNATFVSQSPHSFKIKSTRFIYESNNIQLFTNSNGDTKKVPCVGYEELNKTDDIEYYYIETKGINYLTNADLNYAIGNVTTSKTGDKIFILNFEEGVNATLLPEKVEFKKSKGGLSTGGIIGIIIPTVAVLLGVGALVFFLSRRAAPLPPIKNVINNTIGVQSSDAIVHQ